MGLAIAATAFQGGPHAVAPRVSPEASTARAAPRGDGSMLLRKSQHRSSKGGTSGPRAAAGRGVNRSPNRPRRPRRVRGPLPTS